jgi:tRNA/rRNA methyltransferase
MTDQTDTGPAIILVDPQMGENIGMCARAMLNCGMTDLRIVRPRDGWPSQAARDTSSGAIEVIDNAQVFETTREAVADLHRLYATTGRVREMVETVMTPRKAAADIRAVTAAGQKTGVLFGGERSGLTNDDVALAEIILRVPLNPDFKSLNLAQAVLLVGYEWFTAGDETPDLTRDIGDSRPATRVEFDVFLDRLDKGITEGGFFRAPEMRPTVMRNIRNFFLRAEPTDQDIRTLHGIVEALRRGGGDR